MPSGILIFYGKRRGLSMGQYNFLRPILLIAIALLTKMFVQNLLTLLGVDRVTADNIGFIAMMIAAVVTFQRMRRPPRR